MCETPELLLIEFAPPLLIGGLLAIFVHPLLLLVALPIWFVWHIQISVWMVGPSPSKELRKIQQENARKWAERNKS